MICCILKSFCQHKYIRIWDAEAAIPVKTECLKAVMVEVSFKKGSRKSFYINDNISQFITGDLVVVEAQGGYDVGRISLSGELVRAQMKKKRVDESVVNEKIVRQANHRDIESRNETNRSETGVSSYRWSRSLW